MSHTKNGLIALAAVAAVAGAPSRVHAQETANVLVGESSTVAMELEGRALESLTTQHLAAAARLYRRAAEIRGDGDIKSAENLHTVGYLEYYAGELQNAVVTLRSAGEAYLALGDVERAAEMFIDGAWVAASAGMIPEMHALRDRGMLLTRSPLLDAPERVALVQRLDRVPVGG